jgi:hypothetical protein
MRYMDAQNEKFASKEALAYWESVIYILVETNTQLDIYCTLVFGINSLKTKALRQPKNHSKTDQSGMILGTSAFID